MNDKIEGDEYKKTKDKFDKKYKNEK